MSVRAGAFTAYVRSFADTARMLKPSGRFIHAIDDLSVRPRRRPGIGAADSATDRSDVAVC